MFSWNPFNFSTQLTEYCVLYASTSSTVMLVFRLCCCFSCKTFFVKPNTGICIDTGASVGIFVVRYFSGSSAETFSALLQVPGCSGGSERSLWTDGTGVDRRGPAASQLQVSVRIRGAGELMRTAPRRGRKAEVCEVTDVLVFCFFPLVSRTTW